MGLQRPCPAQPDGLADEVRSAMVAAGREQWSDAVAKYQGVIRNRGDELTLVPMPFEAAGGLGGGPVSLIPWRSPRSIQARWVCHQQIGRLPETLDLYRRRVDAIAARRWEEFGASVSDRHLNEFLGEWFNSRLGEQAILLQAERQFDRAEFGAAIHFWKMLLPAQGDELRYPDPKTPAARTEALILLARLFRGEAAIVAAELSDFRSRHPNANGLLAGRTGNYADTIAALIREPRQTQVAPLPADGREWATSAGFPTRNSFVSVGVPQAWPLEPEWRCPLTVAPHRGGRVAKFHPVIARGRVFLATRRQVLAVNLKTGISTVIHPPKNGDFEPDVGSAELPTFSNGLLYSRHSLRSDPVEEWEHGNAIVALGPIPEEAAEPIPHAWTLHSWRDPKEGSRLFTGPPLVIGRRLFVTVRRLIDGQVVRAIACYRLDREHRRPELQWEQAIGRAGGRNLEGAVDDVLTQAGRMIVGCSGDDRFLAVDAESGTPQWEFRRPVSEPANRLAARPARREGQRAPACLFDGDSLFAVPAEGDALLSLDPWSGKLRWLRDGVNVSQLLGAVQGRLIVHVEGSMKGIRGIDTATGSEAGPFGWMQSVETISTAGRGLVTPIAVYWPTRQGLVSLHPLDGSPVSPPLAGEFGNLAFADGKLVVVTPSELRVYAATSGIRAPAPVPKGPLASGSPLPTRLNVLRD